MIRLWPGCECHPVLPPTFQTLLWTYTSDNPFVFCEDSQIFLLCLSSLSSLSCPMFGRTRWLKTSISPKRPVASVLPSKSVAGVARTFRAYRTVTMIAAPSNTNHVSFLRMLTSSFSLAPERRRANNISQFHDCRQTAIRGIAALLSNAVFCRAGPGHWGYNSGSPTARDSRQGERDGRIIP